MAGSSIGRTPDFGSGGWRFEPSLASHERAAPDTDGPLSGKVCLVTGRGLSAAAAASRARRKYLEHNQGRTARAPAGLTVNELADLYLDGIDADANLSPRTRHDYRRESRRPRASVPRQEAGP